MGGLLADSSLKRYATARQLRNEAEYPQPGQHRLSGVDAEEAIALAKQFYAAIKGYLDGISPHSPGVEGRRPLR